MKASFVGSGSGGKPVLDGRFVFWMMDSQGVPLVVQLAWMEERGWGFSVPGFLEAASRSGNWRPERLTRLLRDSFVDVHGVEQADVMMARLELTLVAA